MFDNLIRNMPPVTKNLIIINFLIFIVMAIAPSSRSMLIDNYCALHFYESPMFNPAQIFTYMFIHSGFMHVFFNMFTLFMFGITMERVMGSRRFLFYYISCGVGAALIQEAIYAIMFQKYVGMFDARELQTIIERGANLLQSHMNYADPTAGKLNLLVNVGTVGASGAIYGVLLSFGMIFPNREIMLLMPPIPLKAKYMVGGFAVIELLLGIGNNAADNVAHFCHLGGMLIGVVIILYWKRKGLFNGYY